MMKMMKKILTIVYEQNKSDLECNVLFVVDQDTTLPNGNMKVIKTLIGSYADEVYKELTEEPVCE